jgi:anti-sigma factor RsiW
MVDAFSDLNERDTADLCAYADGTLPAARRAAVESRLAASPELRELVERQRVSLAATRALAGEAVPASLTAGLAGLARARPASRRHRGLAWASAAGAAAVAVAVVLVLILSGGPSAPTVATPSVAAVAEFGALPPTGPPPATVAGTAQLTAAVEGLPFPDLSRALGWRTLGVRHGRVGARDATAVYYAKGDQRVSYVIVAGPALPPPGIGSPTAKDGVTFWGQTVQGQSRLWWRRQGHTCVIVGTVPQAELLSIASWRAGGTESY